MKFGPKQAGFGRGLGWTALTTIIGLLGLIAHLFQTLLSNAADFNMAEIFKNGSLVLFSATLAAAVAVDIYFDPSDYKDHKNIIKLIILIAVINIIFSVMCYPMILSTPAKDLRLDKLSTITLAMFSTALLVAISAKAITLRDKEKP